MCVILICPPKVRPSRRLLELCELGNPHGAGIAWREAGMVHWFKTEELDQIELLARRKAGEIVIHFRIASVGGVAPALRHPFPVSPRAGLATAGSARTVLFQNGTWLGWQEALERARKAGLAIPGGEWSDTRAAALLAHGTTAAERVEFFGQVASPSRWVWFAARGPRPSASGTRPRVSGSRTSTGSRCRGRRPPCGGTSPRPRRRARRPSPPGEPERPARHITKLEAELDWLYERHQTAKDFYRRFPKPVSKPR
ncbi:MAG: hypothetical protein M5U12_06575 [Verrucomicrobia bacterium]|nr:hypothetical protein [Verrucomicrobiota bacterium]